MGKLRYDVAAASDVGVVRLNNEDAFFCDSDSGLFLVCDGMGGEQAGEVASRIAAQTIPSFIGERVSFYHDDVDAFFSRGGGDESIHSSNSSAGDPDNPFRPSRLLSSAIATANREIHLASEAIEKQRGMGTTVAAVLISDATATLAHVGDSRVYLMRNSSLELLTLDHSVAVEQMRAGMRSDMALRSPYQNYLTRALGPAVEVTPEIKEIGVLQNDLFLLATDGLTGAVKDDEILDLLIAETNVHDACLCLIEKAKDKGSRDNITCVLVRVQDLAEF